MRVQRLSALEPDDLKQRLLQTLMSGQDIKSIQRNPIFSALEDRNSQLIYLQ